MDDALARWLALREPADTAARSSTLTATLQPALAAATAAGTLRILDLGTGTGANVRYLAPRLQGAGGPQVAQHWLAVDRNPALLAVLAERMSTAAAADGVEPRYDVATQVRDLNSLDDEELFAGRHLITASALLDLASESWLATLASRCRAAGAAVLFALSYDGSSTCWPEEPQDDMVRDLLNQHQRRDKGLGGPAAGPEAAAYFVRCLTDSGYHVRAEPTHWDLGPTERELQRELIEGWYQVAIELMPGAAGTVDGWHARRLAHIDAGRSRIVVGHLDIAAWIP